MESVPTIRYIQDNNQLQQHLQIQPTTSQPLNQHLTPHISSTVPKIEPSSSNQNQSSHQQQESQSQDLYRAKCDLLEYHIQEAILINKALRSEVKEYKEKIEFEKNLRKYLLEQAGISRGNGVVDS